MTTAPKLPPAADILALNAQGLTYKEIAAKYDVTKSAVDKALGLARQRGEIPRTARTARTPEPRPVAPVRAGGAGEGAQLLDIRPSLRRPPTAVKADRAPSAVAPPGEQCGALELLGTRVCDKHHHPGTVAHEGEGPRDARAEFWGQR